MTNKEMEDLLFSSIDEVCSGYEAREVSPVEVLEATLTRLDEFEPRLNAFVTVLPEAARKQAKEAEARFLRNEPAGDLAGIPVSLKDLFATKGVRTSMGSRIMKDHIPDCDSYVYSALRRAGAVVFGKNNLLEFAYGFVHPDYGQCNNPWNTDRTSGGSSSGSASSVAAGIGYASVGTDTGGSIRIPASYCGIVGLKPTKDSVSREGCFPLSHTLDEVGPLTRTVGDCATLMRVLAPGQANLDHTPFGDRVSGVKVGLIESSFRRPPELEVSVLVESAVGRLRELGAEIEGVEIPDLETLAGAALKIILSEASYHHKSWYPERADDYADGTRANVAAGFDISAVDYLRALRERQRFTRIVDSLLRDFDVLVSATVPFPAPEKDPEFGQEALDEAERTLPFNFTGHPAITIPVGNTASGNLPVGLQLVAACNDESTLSRTAKAYEKAAVGYRRPPT
jgi:aspartyl-tRNA(Asn)/glutamyl-tRNA(Gln) amidotransferase subunit A